MKSRYGTILMILLLIAGCTRDAGVQPFEPATSGDGVETPLPQIDPLQAQSVTQEAMDEIPLEPLGTEEAMAEDAVEVAITVATETDLPLIDVTATENIAEPTTAPLASPTALPTTSDATSTPATGFTPGVPSPLDLDQPLPTETLVPTVTSSLDGRSLTITQVGGTVVPGGESMGEDAMVESPALSDDGCNYTVQPGDNAYRIAVNNNVTLAELRAANDNLQGENPLLQPGDVIQIPNCGAPEGVTSPTPDAMVEGESGAPPVGATVYVVASGDTVGSIASQYGVTITAIAEANNLDDPNRLSIGQELIIPEPEPEQ